MTFDELLDSLLGPTGIPERLRAANSIFNPVEAVGQSMQASNTLFAPETTPLGRVEAAGNMLSGMAGVVAPAVAASRAGVPAANALADSLTGMNTTAADMGRAVLARLNQPGELGTLGMNGVNLFHGSPRKGLQELDASLSGRGALGPGVYGSPFKHTAGMYARDDGQIYEFTADEVFNGLGRTLTNEDLNYSQIWRDEVARLLAAAPESERAMIQAAADRARGDGYGFFRDLAYQLGSKEAAQNVFKRAGFRGTSAYVDGPEVVMFDSVPLNRHPYD